MAIRIETANRGPLGFKAASYRIWDPFLALTLAKDDEDWSGFYLGATRDLAKSYRLTVLEGKDERHDASSYLHQVHLLKSVPAIICTDKIIGENSLDEKQKTEFVKMRLPSEIRAQIGSGKLIPSLGRMGYLFKNYHDGNRVEIIVPNRLCSLLILAGTSEMTHHGFMPTNHE